MADEIVTDTPVVISDEPWVKSYWRPAMAFLYMLICACDFVIFPVMMILMPLVTKTPYIAWAPLTLSNGGLIHLSFGAILGIAAWTRGAIEKKS